jgi:hypothetical protein
MQAARRSSATIPSQWSLIRRPLVVPKPDPGARSLRQSVKELEQKRLNEARQQLQETIARFQLMPAALEDDKSSNVDPHALEMLQQVLDQTENQQAQGHLVIHVQQLGNLVNSEDNVVLEDQDEIVIPRRPSVGERARPRLQSQRDRL